MAPRITVDRLRLAEFCREHRISRLSFFGSVLRDEFRPDSDVDALAEFEAGARVGLIRLSAIELELSELLGRRVDLRTPAELSRYFRDEVMAMAELQYAKV